MSDKDRDLDLGIRTTDLREWSGKESADYHRTESTPYTSLDLLFKDYKLNSQDVMVDFGAGQGRTSFYVHDRFSSTVRGIELNGITFEDLERNLETYLKKKGLEQSNISFKLDFAEYYEIKPDENIFYFFNPFSVGIFKEVLNNIIESIHEYPRRVDIILYYPQKSFIRQMENRTTFREIKRVNIYDFADNLDYFVVYRYIPGYSD